MNERTIIDFLALQNTWWYKKEFPDHKTYQFKRSDYYYLLSKHLPIREASVIVGSRGVGKSTVLYEIMSNILGFPKNSDNIGDPQKHIEGRRILYVSFDEPSLKKLKLIDLLKIYGKYVLKEDITNLNKKIYVFFDEIQNVPDWGDQIKFIQDLKYPIKFFISGSSSVNMYNEAAKAARRLYLYSMHPLKFSDFLRYKLQDDEFLSKLKEVRKSCKEFLELYHKKKPQEIYDLFLKLYNDLKGWQTKIEINFEEYLIKGGYPGLLNNQDYVDCATKLKQTFWLGFHKDLTLAKGIGDPSGMASLMEYIASISSSETTYKSLSENSNAAPNSEVMKKYLYHLEKAFLIKTSHRLVKVASKKSSSFKIYVTDVAIRNMLTGKLNQLLLKDETQFGYSFETLVFDHALRLFYKIRPEMPLYYWKDSKNGHEVDIVLALNGDKIPIEVKKGDSPPLADLKGLRDFCTKEKQIGLAICGKKLALEDGIVFCPAWLFILLC